MKSVSRKEKARQKFISLAKKYKTPREVQLFLRSFPYNREKKGETMRSAYGALEHGEAHCLEAAFIAAAILEQRGFPPLVLSFESKDKLGHVLFVFKQNGKWGAVGRSRDEGLNGRKPVFRSLRDLVWSYYEPYVDNTGRITEYQMLNLDDTKADWRAGAGNMKRAERYMVQLKHIPLKSSYKRYRKMLARFKKYGHPPREDYWW